MIFQAAQNFCPVLRFRQRNRVLFRPDHIPDGGNSRFQQRPEKRTPAKQSGFFRRWRRLHFLPNTRLSVARQKAVRRGQFLFQVVGDRWIALPTTGEVNKNIPGRLGWSRQGQRHQIPRIQETEAWPGPASLSATGKMHRIRRVGDQRGPSRRQYSRDADGVHGTNRLAQAAPITTFRPGLAAFIPTLPGADISAIVTFGPFIVIIKTAVFIQHKKAHG